MVIGILNFGEGSLAFNYLIFTTVASLGVLQVVAGRGRLVGLMLFPALVSQWIGVGLVSGAYIWFFTVQDDLFIPGLAGGEFFTLFIIGFSLALVIAVVLGTIANRLFARAGIQLPRRRETVALNDGLKAELWLPPTSNPPFVVALREASTDSLDYLSGELVAEGAAVLLCPAEAAEAAVQFAERNASRFHPTRRYAMGVGRGADRVLQLASEHKEFRGALALAPFGRDENALPGLRWLRETDYLEALAITLRRRKLRDGAAPPSARLIYGDEDMLISPATARQIHPSAIMVAGARHFTLARMAATRRLAANLFEMRPAAANASARAPAPASPIRGELGK